MFLKYVFFLSYDCENDFEDINSRKKIHLLVAMKDELQFTCSVNA